VVRIVRLLSVFVAFVAVAAGVTWFLGTIFGDLAWTYEWGVMGIDGEMVEVATPRSLQAGATVGLITGFLAAVVVSAFLALISRRRNAG
jgi:hypothetical protein